MAVIRDGRIVADLPVDELLGQFRDDHYQIRIAAPAAALPASLPAGAELAGEDGNGTATIVVADGDLDTL